MISPALEISSQHLLIRAVNLTEKKVRCACCISAVLPVYSSKLLTS